MRLQLESALSSIEGLELLERLWTKHWPKGIPQSIDYPNISLYEMLKRSADKSPSSTAIIFRTNQITYEKLDDAICRFGTALQGLGIRKGDRVTLYLPNTPQFVIAYFAVLRLGAIVVTCSPLYKDRELARILKDSESRVLVYLDQLEPYVQLIRQRIGLDYFIITRRDETDIEETVGTKTRIGVYQSSRMDMKQLM